jgi:predicted O-linked N-acetylglucosamine transferase (SPINDLY family)
LYETGESEQAGQCFRRVIALQPENAEARWALVMTQLGLIASDDCSVEAHRAGFSRGLQELDSWFDAERVRTAFGVIGSQQPFYLAYQEENNRALLAQYGALCRRIAATWQHDHRLVSRAYGRNKRVRVGLVSAHVCSHPVWHAIIKGWCKSFDPQRIQLHIYYLGKGADRETEFAQTCASKFTQGLVRPRQWAEAILADQIDVLIYPEIGLYSMGVMLAALRLAPVQATTWGHPETSGLPTMDYYISATDFEPANAQQNYTEKLIALPNLGCCYEPPEIARVELTLRDLGLGDGEPLFVCPGTPFKYAPQHDWVYPAIARQLGRCRLAFFNYAPENLSRRLMQRLGTSFAQAGLKFEDHVVQLPWLSKGQFASLLRQADVYLDTIGFSGFNTAMQAIEAGLPIVTREGRFLRGRLASGVLRRMEMAELIAESEESYVNLAVALGDDRRSRSEFSERIHKSRLVLYGDDTPVRALESTFA